MIPQARPNSTFRSPLSPHIHVDGDTCPWCEQDIPPEKLEEISGKIALRQHEQTQAITTTLKQQFDIDKAQAVDSARAAAEVAANHRLAEAERAGQTLVAKAQQQLDEVQIARQAAEQAGTALKAQMVQFQEDSVAREAAAVKVARQAAELSANEKLAEVQRASQETVVKFQKLFDDAETARKTAEQTGTALKAQMAQDKADSSKAIEVVQAAAVAREAVIQVEARQAADAAVASQIAILEKTRLANEASFQKQIAATEQNKAAAEAERETLRGQLHTVEQSMKTQVEKSKADIEAAVVVARQDAVAATQAAFQQQIAAGLQAVTEATTKVHAAEEKVVAITAQHETTLTTRLAEQRELLEKSAAVAVNVEKTKFFEENLKLTTKVEELKRALEKKSNEELGEGAEIDLLEALKAEFPDDDIKPIPKGTQGADIRHIVMLNGNPCGSILYDSKNHNQWRTDHATKLRQDQIADKAEHAILSTRKFPQGTREVHLIDGVVIASPARVVALVMIIRKHLLHSYTLRLSTVEREGKMAALYAFITSERCSHLLGRIDKQAEDLLKIQEAEMKAHKNVWAKQGEAYKSIQKAKGDLEFDISLIIGTGAIASSKPEELFELES